MDYRTRIYERYNSARRESIVPVDRAGLNNRLPYLNRFIARHFPSDRSARILDIGCGYGAILDTAARAGYTRLRGVDSSPELVASAEQLGIGSVVQCDGMEELRSHPDGSLDVVITFDVIEHLTMSELIDMTDEIHRVLAAEGRWIIHTINGASPFFGAIRYGDLTHSEAFTDTSLAQLVLSSGFQAVESFEDEPVPHGLFSTGRLVVWRLTRTLLRVAIAAETGSASRGILSRNFVTVALR